MVEGEWIQSQEIVYNNTGLHQLDDDFLFIRDSYHDGRIYEFVKIESEWVNSGLCISNPDYGSYNEFGVTFFRNEDLLITRSRNIETNQRNLYVFRKLNGSWFEEISIQIEEVFGGGRYINESLFAYGMMGYDMNDEDTNEGAVQIYIRDGDSWVTDSLIFSPEPIIDGRFGYSIDYYQNQLFISDIHFNNDSGAIHIYDYVGGEITYIQTIISSDIAFGDQFGKTISVQNNFLVTNA